MKNYPFFCGSAKIDKALCRYGHATFYRYMHKLKNAKSTFVRYSTSSTSMPSDDADWPKIYGLRGMPYIAAANRMKLYTTTAAILSIPLFYTLYSNGSITFNDISVVCGVATLACVSLFWFSYYCRRLIGHIHFNKDTQIVKISHLTFWARKKVIYVPVNDIVPLTDGTCRAHDAYVKVYRYSNKDPLLLSLRFGKILEKETFEQIFGDLDVLFSTMR